MSNVIRLGDYITEISEKTTVNNQHMVLTSSQEGIVSQDDYFNKQVASKDNTGYKIIRRGQFTYRAMSDTGRFYINRLTDYDIGIVSPAYPVFELRTNGQILPEYLQEYFHSEHFQNAITLSSTGSTRVSLKLAKIADLRIDIPTLPKQQCAVQAISHVNHLIFMQNSSAAKLDQLVKSRFVEMFGEPVTNSKGYPIHQLSDHILFLTSGSRGWAQYYTDKGEWFITIKNVKDCRISVDDVQCINPPKNAEAERTRLREGDLLISITADLGRTGVVTKEIAEHGAYNNQHLTCIRLDRLALDPLYVAFFMESEAGKRQFEAKNMSAVKAGLNFDSIRSLRLIVPPLALQKEFTAFVSEVDKSKLSYEMEVAA